MAESDASTDDRTESDPEGVAVAPERDPDLDARSLTRSDERLLAYLDDVGTDYPAFVAGNTGLYVDHVESRLDALAAAGLVERVSGEAVYRITDAGRDALRDDCPGWSD